jgi:prepilin-type N-terminal cleavage/methylation domain-containing protein
MQKEQSTFKLNKGFSIIEVLLATSLFGLLVAGVAGAYLYGEESTMQSGAHTRAVYLAEEGLEATRSIRDNSFANLIDGGHGLALQGGHFVFSGSSDASGIYTRQVTVKSIDNNRKEVTSQVTWPQNALRNGDVTIVTRLTNFFAALGDWSTPFEEAFFNITGTQNAVKVQVSGNYAYVIRSNNNSANFYILDISNPAIPAQVGTLNISNTPQNIFVSGNFAYITSNSDTRELQIINITNPALPVLAGVYDDAGNDDARGVYVVGNYAYVTFASGVDFAVVDVSNPALPVLAGSLDVANVPNEVVVSVKYAYIASSSNTTEVLVVNVNVPANPALAGVLNLPGNTDANTVSMNGNSLYVGQGNTLRVVDTSNPLAPVLSGQ